MKISVSFLKSKYDLDDTLRSIDSTRANYIHVDLMDGKFVKEKTDTEKIIASLKRCRKPLEVHLMMNDASLHNILPSIYELKPKYIIIHAEIKDPKFFISDIKKHGISVGIAINPDTLVSSISDYIKDVDEVLVMSVYPGLGGQKFIGETTTKLKSLKELQKDNNFIIAVDGGINNETISKVDNLTDCVISGSYVCLSDDFESKIESLR